MAKAVIEIKPSDAYIDQCMALARREALEEAAKIADAFLLEVRDSEYRKGICWAAETISRAIRLRK